VDLPPKNFWTLLEAQNRVVSLPKQVGASVGRPNDQGTQRHLMWGMMRISPYKPLTPDNGPSNIRPLLGLKL